MRRIIIILCLLSVGIVSAQHVGEVGHSSYKYINLVEFIYTNAYSNIIDVSEKLAYKRSSRPSIQLYYAIVNDQCMYFLQWIQLKELDDTDKQKLAKALDSSYVNCNGLARVDFSKMMKLYNQ